MFNTESKFWSSDVETLEFVKSLIGDNVDFKKIISNTKPSGISEGRDIQACELAVREISLAVKKDSRYSTSAVVGYVLDRGRRRRFCWLETSTGSVILPVAPNCKKNDQNVPMLMTWEEARAFGLYTDRNSKQCELCEWYMAASRLVRELFSVNLNVNAVASM